MKQADKNLQSRYRSLALLGAGIATIYGVSHTPWHDLGHDFAFRAAFTDAIGRALSAVESRVAETVAPEIGADAARGLTDASVVVTSTGMLMNLFERAGYALDGVRKSGEVPRFFIASLPFDLPDLPQAAERKRIFIKATLPLVLNANEAIERDRQRVQSLRAEAETGLGLAPDDSVWLDELAAAYGLESMDFDELLNRLEIVPPSLAIAQAAAESGWGTSRFAHQGNALFGQRVWGEGGLAPLKREAADGVKVRAFDDLLDAVRSYTFNLNSHEAYAEFREWRTKLRRAGRPLSGLQLASHLRRYSEQGPEYVKFIETLIRTNGLEAFDGARLGPTAVLQTASGV